MSSMPPPPPPPPPPGGMPPSAPPGYTPYQQVASRDYASFGARLGGYLLDQLLYGLLLSVFMVPGVILGVMAFKDCDRSTDSDGVTHISCTSDQLKGGLLGIGILLGIIGLVVVAVMYLRALGRTGQTWGRKIVGVKVVRQASDAPLGFGLALGRTILEGILGQLCLLNYLWMLWDNDKQTWHDKAVNTVVVRA